MSKSDGCPSLGDLQAFTTGALNDSAARSLEAHLLECGACSQRTLQLYADDTLFAALKNSQHQPDLIAGEDGPRIEQLIESFEALHPAFGKTTDDLISPSSQGLSAEMDMIRDLSATWVPAQGKDELGRIGNYRILEVLGVGGMGGVFLAEDVQLKRRVALKLMLPRVIASAGAVERFLREARTAASLRHPKIVTIFQVGEHSGVPYLAMELLEGESLEDRLRREPLLPLSETIRIGRDIADGLHVAHRQGLVHRDIKPANVWLESSHPFPGEGDERVPPQVKLLDFGLARSLETESELTSSGMILGTPAYMSPEQADSHEIDSRADLFSLGVILYRMTTGQTPFPGRRPLEILKALSTITPVSPRSLNANLPEDLSALIQRLLAKDRNDRPQSAQEVVRLLNKVSEFRDLAFPPHIPPVPHSALHGVSPCVSPPVIGKWRRQLVLLIGLAASVLCGVIFIRIKNPDKSETIIPVPEGATVELVQQPDSKPRGSVPKSRAPGAVTPIPGPPIAIEDAERRFATAALALPANAVSMSCLVTGEQEERQLVPGRPLPDAPFIVTGVKFVEPRIAASRWPSFVGLKGLKLFWVEHAPEFGDRELESLEPLRNILQSLLTYGTKCTGAGLHVLRGAPHLSSINLCDCGPITDASVEHLNTFPSLQHLDLSYSEITDEVFKRLVAPKLAELVVGPTGITSDGLQHLGTFPELQSVRIVAIQLTPASFKVISKLPKLRHVLFLLSQLRPDSVASLSTAPHLQELNIHADDRGMPLTEQQAGLIGEFPHLKTLQLLDIVPTPEAIERIATLNVESLDLVRPAISDDGLMLLAKMTKLTHLSLSGTKVTSDGLIKFRTARPDVQIVTDVDETRNAERRFAKGALALPAKSILIGYRFEGKPDEYTLVPGQIIPEPSFVVTKFRIDGLDLVPGRWPLITGLKALREVDIANVPQFGDLELEAMEPARMTLQTLRLVKTKVTGEGLRALQGAPILDTLEISDSQLSDSVVQYLNTLPGLQDLKISFPIMSDRSFSQLLAPNLKSYHMGGFESVGEGLRHLQAFPKLEEIGISCNVLPGGFRFISEVPKLKFLSILLADISSANVNFLSNASNLRGVRIGTPTPGTSVSVEQMRLVGKLPILEYLCLDAMTPDSGAVNELAKLRTIETLRLERFDLFDDDLMEIGKMTKLARLQLVATKVTSSGLAKFRAARPDVEIDSDIVPAKP